MVKRNKNKRKKLSGNRKGFGGQKPSNNTTSKPAPKSAPKNNTKKSDTEAVEAVTELKKTVKKNPMKLRFSPTAWAKLLYLRDYGSTEVGGFGITLPDDLLYVTDFVLIKQECTSVTVEFDDDDVADFMMDMVESGYKPEQFMRIWIHTHPSMSATPSGTDEATFERVFGKCDWAVMAIVSDTGSQYCRIQINSGPFPWAFEIPMEVDFSTYEFDASDTETWQKQYDENVTEYEWMYPHSNHMHWKGTHGHYGHYTGIYQPKGISNHQPSKPHATVPTTQNLVVDEDEEAEFISGWADVGEFTEDAEGFVYEPDEETLADIPEELLKHISPEQLKELDHMNPLEREYVVFDMKQKLGIED